MQERATEWEMQNGELRARLTTLGASGFKSAASKISKVPAWHF